MLTNVWSVAFCLISGKCTFLIRYFDLIVVSSIMKFWDNLFYITIPMIAFSFASRPVFMLK